MYLIIIDFSYIFHKSYSIINYYYRNDDSHPKDENGKVLPMNLLDEKDRGVMVRKVTIDLCKIINELHGDDVVFCFDDLSFRHDILENYKGGRGDKVPGFSDTIIEIMEIFKSKGLNTLKVKGLEGDDTIALISNDERFSKYTKIIVTKDEDLRQLINPKTFVYVPDSSKKVFYYGYDTQIKFKPKEGEQYTYIKVDPYYVLYTKILKGCDGDKIPQLTPKGYRTKKIEQMYENLNSGILQIENLNSSLEDEIFKSINSLDLTFDREVFDKQLKLVYLNNSCVPEESYQEYTNTFKLKQSTTPYNFIEILKDTIYITEEV